MKILEFRQYELTVNAGAVVVVHLDRAANVRLMDPSNFQRFRQGRGYEYIGGEARRSPVQLSVPHSGRWFVTVDLGPRGGSLRSSVSVV